MTLSRPLRTGRATSRTVVGLIALATLTSSLFAVGAASASLQAAGALHSAPTVTLQAAQSGQAQMKTVACPTPTHCLSIGAASSDQGVISYSTTAGATWSRVSVFDPTTILSLNSLTCPSRTECVAVGASLEHRGVAITGHLKKGAWQWSKSITMANESGAANLPTVALNSVACVSVSNCVAVGSDLTNSINVTTFTTNGGRSWAPDTASPSDGSLVGGYRSQLSSVSCNTATTCVAVGSDATAHAVVVYATFSGGAWSWSTSAQQLPGDGQGGFLVAIQCYNATTCVAVGSDALSQGVATVATLTSSGWTWSNETIVAGDASGWGSLLALHCSSAGTCEAVGVDRNTQSIYTHSANGGVSWSSDVIIANDGAANSTGANAPASIVCTSAARCVIVGTDSLGRAFYSTSRNAGLSWKREARFDVSALPGQGPLTHVSCSGSLCVAVGSNDHNQSVVTRSTDGGRTWGKETLLVSDASGAGYIQGVNCVAKTLCVAVGWDNLSRPVAARSSDGGLKWSAEHSISVDFSNEGFLNSVSCANVHRCVAVGWDGRGQAITTYSLNGGATWFHMVTVTHDATGSGFLYAISCPSKSLCVAVGRDDQFKGVYANSTNGGVGWSGLHTLVSVTQGIGALDDISCPSPALCVAVGGTGTGAGASITTRSSNGGTSWTPEANVALDSTKFGLLTSVACPSATVCVAGGTDGSEQAVTTYSFNKGATWSREATTTSRTHYDFITSVNCATTTSCVAVGADTAQRGIYVPLRFATKVTFVAPGAAGAMAPQSAWAAQHLRSLGFVKKGYVFLGWSLTATGPVRYANRASFAFATSTTLYAQWRKA